MCAGRGDQRSFDIESPRLDGVRKIRRHGHKPPESGELCPAIRVDEDGFLRYRLAVETILAAAGPEAVTRTGASPTDALLSSQSTYSVRVGEGEDGRDWRDTRREQRVPLINAPGAHVAVNMGTRTCRIHGTARRETVARILSLRPASLSPTTRASFAGAAQVASGVASCRLSRGPPLSQTAMSGQHTHHRRVGRLVLQSPAAAAAAAGGTADAPANMPCAPANMPRHGMFAFKTSPTLGRPPDTTGRAVPLTGFPRGFLEEGSRPRIAAAHSPAVGPTSTRTNQQRLRAQLHPHLLRPTPRGSTSLILPRAVVP
ncbi:hypothetical protein THAOC_29240 [Thalassiosira oceanica]|uniref:Uncharacterized protein n=1 Tax=Thalassiosira oceanica TaxID=159749 RepID=K0RED5_THAOC|nr:hypothetical protein THAOC_29240 [Thalassiosira oceanica]|eukprot:EJK51575.1 hypothetical protein THAOC_29240 [Thalassiosira oceanica]